jgi:EpsI family protein
MMLLTRQKAAQLAAPSLKFGLLTAAFLFAYYRTLLSMFEIWTEHAASSHGFIIPFISLYLVWYKRQELKNIPIRPNVLWGTALTFIGAFAGLIGTVGGVTTVQSISIVIIIPGLVWMLLGNGYLKALALPLLYLLLMPPVVDLFTEKIYWPLQLFSTTIAAWLIKTFQISAFQHLQYIRMPNITLEVTKQCSGVHILICLTAVGILLSYLTQRGWWRRIILVVLAIIIGLFTNGLRVAFIGIWAHYSGKDIEGAYHIFNGLLMSVIGFSLLFFSTWVMDKIPSGSAEQPSKSGNLETKTASGKKHKFHASWLVATIVLLAFGSYEYFYSMRPQQLQRPMSEVPFTIGDWRGKDVYDHLMPVRPPGADREMVRVYRNTLGQEVTLYVGYFESQKLEKTLVSYTLQDVYEESKEIKIPLRDLRSFIRVNEFSQKDDNRSRSIFYFYDLDGRTIANRYQARFLTALNGLMYGRTNGAVIAFFVHGRSLRESGDEQDVAIDFLRQLLPLLDSHLSSYNNQ